MDSYAFCVTVQVAVAEQKLEVLRTWLWDDLTVSASLFWQAGCIHRCEPNLIEDWTCREKTLRKDHGTSSVRKEFKGKLVQYCSFREKRGAGLVYYIYYHLPIGCWIGGSLFEPVGKGYLWASSHLLKLHPWPPASSTHWASLHARAFPAAARHKIRNAMAIYEMRGAATRRVCTVRCVGFRSAHWADAAKQRRAKVATCHNMSQHEWLDLESTPWHSNYSTIVFFLLGHPCRHPGLLIWGPTPCWSLGPALARHRPCMWPEVLQTSMSIGLTYGDWTILKVINIIWIVSISNSRSLSLHLSIAISERSTIRNY